MQSYAVTPSSLALCVALHVYLIWIRTIGLLQNAVANWHIEVKKGPNKTEEGSLQISHDLTCSRRK